MKSKSLNQDLSLNKIPTEDQESIILAKWLKLNKYKFTHLANQSGQWGTKNIIAMMIKKKNMGVSKGVPDFMIILKRGSLLFIELKRRKKILRSGKLGASPSKVSEEQKDWILKLNLVDNIAAEIAYGSQEAIDIIKEYENF